MDYRYEILKILYEKRPNQFDLRPIIMEWINKGHSRASIGDALNNMRSKFIVCDAVSLTVSTGGVYLYDEAPINAAIKGEGIEEFLRLDEIYNPKPSTTYNLEGSTVGIFNSGKVEGNQSLEESALNSPQMQNIKNTNINSPNKMSPLEILSWIACIVGGLMEI